MMLACPTALHVAAVLAAAQTLPQKSWTMSTETVAGEDRPSKIGFARTKLAGSVKGGNSSLDVECYDGGLRIESYYSDVLFRDLCVFDRYLQGRTVHSNRSWRYRGAGFLAISLDAGRRVFSSYKPLTFNAHVQARQQSCQEGLLSPEITRPMSANGSGKVEEKS